MFFFIQHAFYIPNNCSKLNRSTRSSVTLTRMHIFSPFQFIQHSHKSSTALAIRRALLYRVSATIRKSFNTLMLHICCDIFGVRSHPVHMLMGRGHADHASHYQHPQHQHTQHHQQQQRGFACSYLFGPDRTEGGTVGFRSGVCVCVCMCNDLWAIK